MPSYARKHQLAQSLIYHIYNRSHRKTFIFKDGEDFEHFKGLLKRYNGEFDVKIYHWVIMSNHYHLLLELKEPQDISSLMAGLGRAYTHYHHQKYKTTGYLWEGRFKLQAVEKESYLLAGGRYIERNPVRAGMVKLPWEYLYSSSQYYCEGKNDELTQKNPVFEEFGQKRIDRQEAYKKFLEKFDQEEEARFRRLEEPVGGPLFVNRLIQTGYRSQPRHRGRPRDKNLVVTY